MNVKAELARDEAYLKLFNNNSENEIRWKKQLVANHELKQKNQRLKQ